MKKQAAIAVLNSLPGNTKVADVYDDNTEVVSALVALFPEFEYPDFSHLTLKACINRAKAERR